MNPLHTPAPTRLALARTPAEPASSADLAEAILDAFPSGSYAMTGLLRLLDIVATSSVPTAAVECLAQPRMLINPAFVAAHADTPEKLLMLVMHELHHVLLGHTTLFPRSTPEQNLVFDAVINGLLCRMFPGAAYTAFFTDYYRDDCFPECLLRPPRAWPEAGFSACPGLLHLETDARTKAQEVHAALYSEGGASYREVYEILPKILAGGCSLALGDVPLLGGHNPDGRPQPDLRGISPLLFDLVRELVEQWPQPPDPIRGRSLADVLTTSTVVPPRQRSRRGVLRQLIRKVAGLKGNSRLPQLAAAATPVQSPLPSLSRRSVVLQAMGLSPLLHPAAIPWKARRESGALVHIYLDVSGSMSGIVDALYGAALDCKALLHPKIHLFSTIVVDITPAELRAGRCDTTGGTCIGAVAEHMATHRIRRAVMVTDGWVGRPHAQHRKTLQDARLAVAFMGQSFHRDDLEGIADYTAVIPTGDPS